MRGRQLRRRPRPRRRPRRQRDCCATVGGAGRNARAQPDTTQTAREARKLTGLGADASGDKQQARWPATDKKLAVFIGQPTTCRQLKLISGSHTAGVSCSGADGSNSEIGHANGSGRQSGHPPHQIDTCEWALCRRAGGGGCRRRRRGRRGRHHRRRLRPLGLTLWNKQTSALTHLFSWLRFACFKLPLCISDWKCRPNWCLSRLAEVSGAHKRRPLVVVVGSGQDEGDNVNAKLLGCTTRQAGQRERRYARPAAT